MNRYRKNKTKELYDKLKLLEIITEEFKVEKYKDKIETVYKNRFYTITVVEKNKTLYWILTPFKDTVFQIEEDIFDFTNIFKAIKEDYEFINFKG